MKIRYNKVFIAMLLTLLLSFLPFRLSYANLRAFGDVTGDGKADSIDSYVLLEVLAWYYPDTPLGSGWQHLNGDVNGDDIVDVVDSALIAWFDACLIGVFENTPDSIEKFSGDKQSGTRGSTLSYPLRARVFNYDGGLVGNAYITFEVVSGDATISADGFKWKKKINLKTKSGLNCFGCSRVYGFGTAGVSLKLGNTAGKVKVRVSSPGISASSRGYGWGSYFGCNAIPALIPVNFTAYNYGVKITSPPSGSFFRLGRSVTFVAETIPSGKESSIKWSGGGSPSTGSGRIFTTKFTKTGVNKVKAKLTISGESVSASRSVTIIGIDFSPSTLYLRRNQSSSVEAEVSPSDYASSVSFESSDTNIATLTDDSAPTIRIKGVGVGSTTIKAYYDSLYLKSMKVNVVDVSFNPTTLYLGKNQTGPVSVTVNPSGYASSVSFVSSDTNIATLTDDSAPTISIYGKAPGTATVSAFIGDNYFTSMTVNVVDVQIIEPNNDPVTDNNFTFNAASPGVCDVNANGTSGISSEDSNLIWSIPAIAGSSLSSIPPTPAGPIITFRYTSLPSINNQFGNKTLSLSHSLTGDSDSQIVQIFFSAGATNHPGAGSGTTPNWYYYWTRITGTSNLAYGGPSTLFGYYDFSGKYGPPNKCIIYDNVILIDNTTGPMGKAGIDCFGQTVEHERKHKDQFLASGYPDTNGDGIPDYDPGLDQDGDWLSDSYEIAHGFNWQPIDSNGNGIIDPSELAASQDTDGDGILDLEEEPIQAEFNWPNDSHNGEDWADPGKNSSK